MSSVRPLRPQLHSRSNSFGLTSRASQQTSKPPAGRTKSVKQLRANQEEKRAEMKDGENRTEGMGDKRRTRPRRVAQSVLSLDVIQS